jgi:hypothetical protein
MYRIQRSTLTLRGCCIESAQEPGRGKAFVLQERGLCTRKSLTSEESVGYKSSVVSIHAGG